MYANVILPVDRGHKAYRLRCRFTVNAFPNPTLLERAKYRVAEEFVADMAKQGYEYLDAHGFKMTGPFPNFQISEPVKRSHWQTPSRELLPMLMAGLRPRSADVETGLRPVTLLDESESWDYELAGVFVHKTIVIEYADAHEEAKELRRI